MKSRVCVVDRAIRRDTVVDLVAELVDGVDFGAVEPCLVESFLSKSVFLFVSEVACKRSWQLGFVLFDFVFLIDVASDVVAVGDLVREFTLLGDGLLASDFCLLSIS